MPGRISREKIKENPEALGLADSLDRFTAIKAVAASEGGQIIVKALVKDIIGVVEAFANGAAKLEYHQLIKLACSVKEKLDIVHMLTRAKKNAKWKKEELKKLLNDEIVGIEEE